MDTTTALTLELGSLHQPVVTTYQLGTLLFRLYHTKTYQGKPLTQLKKDFPEPLDLKRMTDQLLENGVLQPHKDFAGGVFVILGKEPTASEVACGVDPFAYLSHLSAMEHHGLTNRMPKMLFLSSPPPTEWRQSALARMKRDLGASSPSRQRLHQPAFRGFCRRSGSRLARRDFGPHLSGHAQRA